MDNNINQLNEEDKVDSKQAIDTNSQYYIPQAIPKTIKFCSRISVKVQENFYTIEYGEEREIPNFDLVNLEKERQALIDDCNRIVDREAEEIYKTFLK